MLKWRFNANGCRGFYASMLPLQIVDLAGRLSDVRLRRQHHLTQLQNPGDRLRHHGMVSSSWWGLVMMMVGGGDGGGGGGDGDGGGGDDNASFYPWWLLTFYKNKVMP